MTTFKPRLIAFMNAYSQGKSGGDMVFIEIAKRIKKYDKIIVTSLLGKKLCQESGLRGEYLITSREPEFYNVIWTYIKRIIRAFFLKLKPKNNDILLGTSDFLPDVLPIFWLKIRNKEVKWVQHIFHLIPPSRKISFFTQRVSFLLIKQLADLIIVDNDLLRDDLVKLGFDPQKISVNYLGIDLGYLRSVKTKAEGGYEGIFMAQLRPSKGIFDLIKIWKLVCQRNPKATLGIIGKGERRVIEDLKKEIKSFGLEKNIYLLGYLEDKRAFTTIKASKIFVFPSYEEGFGIAPLEAQALGLPVVAWNLPVFEEIFPKGMIKIEIRDIQQFSREIIKLLTEGQLYLKLSKDSINNSNRFDWDRVVEKELKLIDKFAVSIIKQKP